MWVIVGLVVGWLAGAIMKGSGYGLVGDIAIAVVGAIAGAWLISSIIAEADRGGVVGTIIAAIVGAAAFVALARLLTRRRTPV